MTRDELREKLTDIVSAGLVSRNDRMHGGDFYVVGLDMRALPERYPDEDDAEDALTKLRVDAIMALLP